MALEQQIQQDIKNAMLAKDTVALASVRAIKAAILLAKTSEGGDGEIDDNQIIKIIQKLVKQRKESAEIYATQNRPELAQNEIAEAAVMEKYLPKPLSEEEIEAKIKTIIAELGVSGPAAMGKVMGVATKALAGVADGKVISAIVKKVLQNQ
ncbi:MAG: GatB/YqeY domain-containing protein [Bacteroidales bacterium]|nr:GatB/YqeY domain-containing protein [Bacteroidales bacterium]